MDIEFHYFATFILCRKAGKENFLESDWYKFQKAVNTHRDFALNKFMPLFEKAGLLASF